MRPSLSRRVERRQVFVLTFADLVQLAVVIAGRRAGFVVAQPGFHVRDDFAQRLERERMELVES
jgi:hypothetical protein